MALATSNLAELSLANHDFSMSLYSKFHQQDGNIFYSPFSIHLIMFMASVGAVGQTFDEIMNTLHLSKNNHTLDSYKELLDILNQADVLKIANGMFVDNSFEIKQNYLEKTNKYLKTSMDKLDFKGNPEAQRAYLNVWVQNRTNGKIKDLFSPGSIQSNTALVLANAMHFKNGWMNEFYRTQNEPFYSTVENKVDVKMMMLSESLNYYHDDAFKYAAVELPFANEFFKMIVLLPDAKDGLESLEKNLVNIKLTELSQKMISYDVFLKLPKFKIEQTFDLQRVLAELNCSTMFSRRANFSQITETPLYVSKMIHKAYVDVNEKGAEAAAATSMVFMTMSLRPPKKNANFIADHPFVFAIMTNRGDVLFMGRFKQP